MPERHEYTIGWVTALPIERAAAELVLDKTHPRLDYNPNPRDSNTYLLGEIGEHNIVICVLPKREYGTATAAGAATHMLNTFPNIRLGLMVGVGGGAPSGEHDIRLGDVVVGSHDGKHGGVFELGYVGSTQEHTPRRLSRPPQILRTAAADTKRRHLLNGATIGGDITRIIKGNPRHQRLFQRPDQDCDRLFQRHVEHSGPKGRNCAEQCAADKANLVNRRLRTEGEDNPAIHYGLIASSNQLIKNVDVRDRFSKEKGVLCFEMEAAGLMNILECLVIRGICDYSDSHKNKMWQPYAALAAAVYARDVLVHISPSQVKAQWRVLERLAIGHCPAVEIL